MKPFYNPDTTSIKAPKGQGCPRCGGAVFAAEQQLAKGTVSWNLKSFNRLPFEEELVTKNNNILYTIRIGKKILIDNS